MRNLIRKKIDINFFYKISGEKMLDLGYKALASACHTRFCKKWEHTCPASHFPCNLFLSNRTAIIWEFCNHIENFRMYYYNMRILEAAKKEISKASALYTVYIYHQDDKVGKLMYLILLEASTIIENEKIRKAQIDESRG